MHTLPSHQSRRPGMVVLLLLALAQLMVILDISAVNVALPDLAKDLDIGGGAMGWTITSYSLVFGSLLLLGGRAADLLGRRRVFLTGLGVFTVASLASALATGEGVFFAARAGQGLGAAMLSPAALSIITTTFHGPDARRRSASGVRSAAPAPPSASCWAGRSPSSSTGEPSSSSTCPSGSPSPSGRGRSCPPTSLGPGGAASTSAVPWSPPRAWRRSSTPSPKPPMPAGRHCRRSASASPAWLASPRSRPWNCTPASLCSTSRGWASAESAAASS